MLKEIVIPGLYLLSGSCCLAAINHLVSTLYQPRDRVNLLFSGMCLLAAMFGLSEIWAFTAETVDQVVPALKWNTAVAALFFILFLWFIAEYSELRPKPLLTTLSLIFALLFAVNLMQPYSLQYEDIKELQGLDILWNEIWVKPTSRGGVWFVIGVMATLTTYGYALYALDALYRKVRLRTVLIMMFVIGLLMIALIEGILVRMPSIDFALLGSFGYLVMVITMGVILSYETQVRLRASESRFRSLVEQSPFSIQILSPEGETRSVNPAWEKLWGTQPGVLKDYNILEDRQLIDKGVMPYIERGFTGEAVEIPAVLYGPSENAVIRGPETDRWIRAHVYPIKDKPGRITDVILKHEDVTQKKQIEDAIHEIAAGVSAASGQTFFCQLVQHLAKLFDAEYSMIGVPKDTDSEWIHTLAVYQGRIVENICYRLAGTPCANVLGRSTRIHPSGVRFQFPDDRRLSELGAEGYIGTPLFGSAGQPLGLIVVIHSKPIARLEPIRDILGIFAARAAAEIERTRTEQSLQRATDELRATIEFTPNVAIQWYDQAGKILFWNRASETMFGWRKEEALGKTLDQLIYSPEENAAFLMDCSKVQRTGKPTKPTENTFKHRDGTLRICISTLFALPGINSQPRFVRMDVDITEHKRAELEIHRMAYQDGLTELANRTALQEYMERLLASERFGDYQSAMLLIDLDHFKIINDALGHNVGDEILYAVARRLCDTVGERGFPARLGGDEFVVVMGKLPSSEEAATTKADALAQEIANSLAIPIVLGERLFSVGASIGVTLFQNGGGGTTVSDILRRADMALYRAKNLGRGNIQFFLPTLQAIADQRLHLERGLRSAIAKHELEIYFQPQVTAHGRVFGAEVLLRCRHPDLNMVSPSKFIPVAEETGLIHGIGEWVLHQACSKLASWLKSGTPFSGHISVNLSPWQFACPGFVQSIQKLTTEYGIPPERLVLEITESTLLYDIQETTEKLAELRSAGFKVSLDDFGTGYSSLAYLKDLPLDILKIDKTFIDELTTESKFPLVETIIALGNRMNLAVIAEGIETAEQRDLLINLGCNGFQGYLFCRPLPEEKFVPWFMKQNQTPSERIHLKQ